ncbi:MAG: O-antigen ligase family protein [Lachnospiraceae bacterium]|nr:O-antigen ligase family protein [Lachnospiraceae bacterium]
MRKALWQSEAIRAILVIVTVLAVLSVFPLRLWQRTIVEKGGGVRMEESSQLDDEASLTQDFTAQYDRLGAVDIDIAEVMIGRYMMVAVFDERGIKLCHRYVDLGSETIPGRVRVPLGLDLEVGKDYRLLVQGAHCAFRTGLQNIPAEGASPYVKLLRVAGESVETWHLDMELLYRQPIDKKTSLLIIAIIALIGLLAERAVAIVAKKRGEAHDRIVTVGGTVTAILAPVFTAAVLVLMALVGLQKYDRRPADITFYLLGLLIVGAIGASFILKPPAGYKIPHVIDMIQAVCFAMAIQAACEYMNGLYDIMHQIASRKEVIWLSVFFLLFLFGKRVEPAQKLRINLFGLTALVFFAMIIFFRNTRLWGVTLAALFLGGLVCYFFSPRRDRWLSILTAGLVLNFAANVVYCLLHRYFVAFVNARFAFIFHTVTVTAEYLTMMDAAAFVLLFAAILRVPKGTKFGELLLAVRPEAVFFGAVSAYALFTVSRMGILALGVSVFLLLLVISARDFGKGLIVAALSALLCFPAVFTLQRILPPMAGHPVFMEVEDASPEARGAVNWDNTFLISVERFGSVFFEKMTGIENSAYNYPEDRFNYNEAGEYLYPRITGGGNPASAGSSEDSGEDGAVDAEKLANGRFTIWRTYLPQLNLTGHEDMGVEMPNGEIMVHAHNVYLQIAHDNGILTGIVFILLIAFALVTAAVYGRMRNPRGRENAAGAPAAYVPFALTVGFAVAGLTEWNFHLGNMMTIAMLSSWIPLCFKVRK